MIAAFITRQQTELAALVTRFGSPLNIVWPHTIKQNIDKMHRVLERHAVAYAIFYGAKVNKSKALVRAAVAAGIGIDVSSLAELEDSFRAGAGAARICATGPAKTAAFHRTLVTADALIAVDSIEELTDLGRTLRGDQRARILLRLRPDSERGSRFGMDHDVVIEALQHVVRYPDRFSFEGYHLHLRSYIAADRIAAMPEVASLVGVASRFGLATRMIDIGGGMPIRYVASDDYDRVLRAQGPANYRNARVPADFYPYGSRQTVDGWLDEFLSAPWAKETIAAYFRTETLRLAIEPGRSLVDQAAISIFRITRVKPLGDGTAVIFVEGSSFSACETWFNSEFLVDPILLPASPGSSGSAALRAYIAGHSCLDGDIVTNRLLEFSETPKSGDLLIYANTAGYQMDLLENEFHRHPVPVRLSADTSASDRILFLPDN